MARQLSQPRARFHPGRATAGPLPPAVGERAAAPASPILPTFLAAALLAVCLVAGLVLLWVRSAQQAEDAAIHDLAPLRLDLLRQGSALQSATLRQPDLLLVYGASELYNENDYHASVVFGRDPSGFAVVPVTGKGTGAILYLQQVAALGGDLRGRKVVVSITASSYEQPALPDDYYAGNYSRLHAYALVFSTDLSFELKRAAARRMLTYPETLQNDPLLLFATRHLAGDSLADEALYALSIPLGKLHAVILGLQDHWEAHNLLLDDQQVQQARDTLGMDPAAGPHALDWSALLGDATQAQRAHATNNPYGFENSWWKKSGKTWLKQRAQGKHADFAAATQRSAEWTDLDLLLDALTQVGAQPLLVSQPLNEIGDYADVPAQDRAAYYDRLQAIATRYGVPLQTFREHAAEPSFLMDSGSHPSRIGWVYLDATLDAFYHDRDPRALPLPPRAP